MFHELNESEVNRLFNACLCHDELKNLNDHDIIHVEGIHHSANLRTKRIEENYDDITLYLSQLPDKFKKGWTFLEFGVNKKGDKWTSHFETAEKLLLLGIAAGRVEYINTRNVWEILPSGLPYVKIV